MKRKNPVGTRIRQARDALDGVPVERLERAAGLPEGRLTAIELGVDEATQEELERIAVKLKRNPVELSDGPLLPQSAQMRADVQRLIGNSQGGRQSTASPEDRARLAANLRAFRDASGLSQSQAGNAVGIATNNMSVFESPTGKYGPSPETLGKLAALYRCTVEDLTGPVRTIVVRAKLSGDVGALSPERRDQLIARMADWERRFNKELLDEIEAEQAKQKRRR